MGKQSSWADSLGPGRPLFGWVHALLWKNRQMCPWSYLERREEAEVVHIYLVLENI